MEKRIRGRLFFMSVLLTFCYIPFDSLLAAEKYPSRPIELVIPFNPGGAADFRGRIVARHLAKVLGVPVVPINKAGGGTIIGASYVINSRPDGYTILSSGDSFYIEIVAGRAPYKVEDLRVIALFAYWNCVLAVPADSPWKTFQEFMDYARKNPGTVTYGCSPGSSPYISMEHLKRVAKLSLVHVPFPGDAEAITALLGKHLDMGVLGWTSSAKSLADTGKLRILFSFGRIADFWLERSIPDWDTVFKGIPSVVPGGFLFVPAKTPDEIVRVLEKASEKITNNPEYIEEMKRIFQAPTFMDGKAYTERVLPQTISIMNAVLKGTDPTK